MGQDSSIEWTHHTFNPWRGCTKVSAGCANCYADTLSKRNPKTLGVWGPRGTRVVAAETYWRQPLAWDKAAAAAGERHRVFCASLADVFEGPETMPAESHEPIYAARLRLFEMIWRTPHLDWLLLTKRPENILPQLDAASRHGDQTDQCAEMLSAWQQDCPPANVWLGTSVEDQAAADARIPHLLRCPAAVRFLSCEPLLSDILLWRNSKVHDHLSVPLKFLGAGAIGWVIVGGESGPHARPMHPAWARSIRDQCAAAGVPFFYKQTGEWQSFYDRDADDPDWRCIPRESASVIRINLAGGSGFHGERLHWFRRVSKHAAGRLLDGVEHNGFPTPAGVAL